MIGSQSEKDHGRMVSINMIKTSQLIQLMCPMLAQYLDQTLLVLEGKQFRRKPKSIVEEYVAVQKKLVSRHKFISIAADVFFVDGIAFLLTVAKKTKVCNCGTYSGSHRQVTGQTY